MRWGLSKLDSHHSHPPHQLCQIQVEWQGLILSHVVKVTSEILPLAAVTSDTCRMSNFEGCNEGRDVVEEKVEKWKL